MLEEETSGYLHRTIRLRASDLAEAGRCSEGCRSANLANRKRTARRREVGMVDDVEEFGSEFE